MSQWISISHYSSTTCQKPFESENHENTETLEKHSNNSGNEQVETPSLEPRTITEKFTESMKSVRAQKALNKNYRKPYNVEGTNRLLKPLDGYISRFKYNGFVKKSHWHYYDENRLTENGPETEAQYNYRMKKKHKFCILMAFAGGNYYGMQYNCSLKTIEDALLKAMVKNEWILPEHYDKPFLVDFIRGSRTDRGVSAARMNVSVVLRKCS